MALRVAINAALKSLIGNQWALPYHYIARAISSQLFSGVISRRATVRAIAAKLELDYFGVDFSIIDEQQLLVFEANAGMRVNPDFSADFPYLAPQIEKLISRFQHLVERKLAGRQREVS